MIGLNGCRGRAKVSPKSILTHLQSLFGLFKLNVAVSDTLLDLCCHLHFAAAAPDQDVVIYM